MVGHHHKYHVLQAVEHFGILCIGQGIGYLRRSLGWPNLVGVHGEGCQHKHPVFGHQRVAFRIAQLPVEGQPAIYVLVMIEFLQVFGRGYKHHVHFFTHGRFTDFAHLYAW